MFFLYVQLLVCDFLCIKQDSLYVFIMFMMSELKDLVELSLVDVSWYMVYVKVQEIM